jgi:hypothetical protein
MESGSASILWPARAMPRKGGHAPKKAPGTAVDKRNGRKLELKTDRLERFDPPSSAGPEARTAWEAYWDDPVSTLATRPTVRCCCGGWS